MSSLTVFRGWKDAGKFVWSPFVIKLEARLRFAGVHYTAEAGSPKTAPKGKIPYVEIRGADADADAARDVAKQQMGDSTLIVKALIESKTLPDLNAPLSPVQRAADLALRAMLEDKLCFYHMWERWTQNYYVMREHVFRAMPYPVRVVVGLVAHRSIVATLHGQGTGRYTAEEITEFRWEIWNAVNDLLTSARARSEQKEGPFWVFGGKGPTEADATVFGFIASVLVCRAAPGSQKVIRGFPVVLDYASRIQAEYFPDYEKWSM